MFSSKAVQYVSGFVTGVGITLAIVGWTVDRSIAELLFVLSLSVAALALWLRADWRQE